ncbi:lasso peptide biosynthesis B2 protein [Granulicella paludicola]|uniref:lasso peptide biosynthesis B2 protein n=1 Tax=Granulicella paludicola TaxID=474951 RepID=UPI0037BE4284
MSLRHRVRLLPLAAEASWWLGVTWLLVDLFPGHLYLRLLPPKRTPLPYEAPDSLRPDPRVHKIANVVKFISKRLPVRSVCIHRGIAVDRMLRSRGIQRVMHYGVLRENGALKAHVWITSAGFGIIGTHEAAPYTEVAQFVEVPQSSLSVFLTATGIEQTDPGE